MILLELFLVFLKIGAVSFGGGYGMIALIRDEMLARGWLGEDELLAMIAVAESTPGPIAVNMATFVGSAQGGFPGALLATLGVILPSFILILVIAAALRNLMKYRPVSAALSGIRPVIASLVISTAIVMILSTLVGFSAFGAGVSLDFRAIAVFIAIAAAAHAHKRLRRRTASPIALILLSALLGVILYI